MLKQMSIKNLTVFTDVELQFSSNLNVIIGENGVGKTHLLKAAYALMAASAESGKKPGVGDPTKTLLQKVVAEKLIRVMRPEHLGRLVRRKQGRDRCELAVTFDESSLDCTISFASNAKAEVQIDALPTEWQQQSPLYLPTRELLTIYPGFVSLYESHYLEFEETWRDTCLLLGTPMVRGPRENRVSELLEPIEAAMEGKSVLDANGRFYLQIPGGGRMEMPLVAEGIRKLAMLARLIAVGAILDKGFLFWDEPEANLNPRLIRLMAGVIHSLAMQGIQIFIATHSYFLLKELDILARKSKQSVHRYFGLTKGDGESGVLIEQVDHLTGLTTIVSLDEELAQYDREMELSHG